jgi:hypothetical protein
VVGAGEESRGDLEPESGRCTEIDNEVEFRWLLDRKIARRGALENAVNVHCTTPPEIREIRSIRQQAACLGRFAVGEGESDAIVQSESSEFCAECE